MIRNILSDSEFQKKIIKDTRLSGFAVSSYFYKQLDNGDGISALIDFLTDDQNLDKIAFQDTNNRFWLNLVYEYNPHFVTNEALSINDFPSGRVYTLDLRSRDGVRQILDDSDLQKLLNRKDSYGLVVCYHLDVQYSGSVILVPSDRLHEIKGTNIKIGYKYEGFVYRNIFACDNVGTKLISKLDFSDQGIKIRSGSSWVFEFYGYDPLFEDGVIIGYESNFYAAYLFGEGRNYRAVLQDTRVLLEHIDPFRDPLHNVEARQQRMSDKVISGSSRIEYKFKNFFDLDKNDRNIVGEVVNIIEQFNDIYLPSRDSVFRYESISEMIISKEFFKEEDIDIESVWNELDPSLDKLATLSTKLIGISRQRLFYQTLHEILLAYTGNNKLINDYISIQGYVKFVNRHSSKFTKAEFKAIEHMEEILPLVFGYRFYTFIKLGLLNLYKEGGSVKFQALTFDISLLRDIMNQRRVKAISARTFNGYTQGDLVRSFDNIMACIVLFGHSTILAVEGEGRKVIYTKCTDSILSRLVEGDNFQHFDNPLRYSSHYGSHVKAFLNQYYGGGINQDLRIRRNIIGKTAIMKGFSHFLTDAMNPEIIRLAGEQLNIKEFHDNPEVWSEKCINYAFAQIFGKLINPEKASDKADTYVRDPVLNLVQVFTGVQQVNLYKIAKGSLRGATSSFWFSNEFGKLRITYPTLTYYFGNDFYKIQPALYYRHYNIKNTRLSKDLSLQHLLTAEFKHKIRHLYDNFYNILSENYGNNQKITANFHIEKSLGLGHKTRITDALNEGIKTKFNDLIRGTSLKITLKKEAGEIVNKAGFKAFVSSIVFYLVMFNAIVFISESDTGYSLFASQKKIYDNNYITGLYSRDEISSIRLSQTGEQIYNTWQTQWNQEDEKTVWNFEDCWPIFLLDDARDLITFFNDEYNIVIRALS